jgi:protein-tyrosine phosphatase
VLIHCAHGHGRSATLLAAVLIADGAAEGVAEAEAAMRAVRPRVKLNRRQQASLVTWLEARGGAKQQ